MDLLDVTEHLLETQSQLAKLQTSLDDVTKEKVPRHFFSSPLTLRIISILECARLLFYCLFVFQNTQKSVCDLYLLFILILILISNSNKLKPVCDVFP